MAEWQLFWILTVLNYQGVENELPEMSTPLQSKLECEIEAKAKRQELESEIGEEYYTTEHFGGRVRLGGYLVGVKVGCRSND